MVNIRLPQLDRYYDSRDMIGYLKENENAFIIRSQGKRGLVIGESEQSFQSVVKPIQLTARISSTKKDTYFDCGIKRVQVRLDPHPKQHPEKVEV